MTTPTETMSGLTFGVEIETVGCNRRVLAEAIARAVGGTSHHEGGGYDKWVATMPDGRKWTAMSDGSLSDHSGLSGEVVTPICKVGDMDTVQAVIRAIRGAGARVNATCGIHVHVGAQPFDGPALARLAKLTYQQEPLIFEALGVQMSRRGRWARSVEETLIDRLSRSRPTNPDAVLAAWYGGAETVRRMRRDYAEGAGRQHHYNETRYHGLNLHAVLDHGTIEFRYFEATLHAGEVRAYVQFCLALAAKALTGKSAVARKRIFSRTTAKYDFRVFLLRLGMIGDEFKTARTHLMKKLEGSASWKNGRPAPAAPASAPEVGVDTEASDG